MPGGWQNESIRPDSFTEIDSWNPNDKNWWCPYEPDRQLVALRKQADATTGFPDYFDWTIKRLGNVYDPSLRAPLAVKRDSVLRAHPMVKDVDWKELQALTRMAQAPDAPTARELVKDPDDLALLDFAEFPFFMAFPFAAPPGIPADRADILSKSFMAMATNEEFRAEILKAGILTSPIDGEAIRALIIEAANAPRDIKQKFARLLGM
jgi:hypothetical protein